MMLRLVSLLKGISTYVPGWSQGIFKRRTPGEGTGSARYCYSIWLRHLVAMHENHLPTQFDVVAELGPGNSLGVGLAALLSGVNRYYALDVVDYQANDENLEIFNELIGLFEKRARIPNAQEFPEAKPLLSSYEFPHHLLTQPRLRQALTPERVESIRKSLSGFKINEDGNARIAYFVPWSDSKVIREGLVDLVYAQAVLEHVSDLDRTYEALSRWLKPGGIVSCQIDFRCHETAHEWNGHWTYSDFIWTLIRGRRPYLLNRHPHSLHSELLRKHGFEIICDRRIEMPSKIQRNQLAPRFKDLSEEDLTTSGAFIQALKKA